MHFIESVIKYAGFVAIVIVIVETIVLRILWRRYRLLLPRYKVKKYRRKLFSGRNLSLGIMDSLSGIEFEGFCCDLLRELGYKNILVTRTTGDYGLDIICENNGLKYGIQCKCYNSSIGVDAVQQAYAGCAYYGCTNPVVMTNQYFTDAAQEMARVIGVTLWSRHFFNEKIEYLKRNSKKFK